jgi:predicted dehydrogenase
MEASEPDAPVRLAIIGVGQRGAATYGSYALRHPAEVEFVAAADPDADRLTDFAAAHAMVPAATFEDWHALFAAGPDVDGVIVATPDRAHFEPAAKALALGLPVLLEKPVSHDPEQVLALADQARATGDLTVAHSLRYTPLFASLKGLLESGSVGEVVGIDHVENIGYWHFAHSYVRGNWRRADLASPMILAKACHDLDILRWLAAAPPRTVTSVGGRRHFHAGAAPPGATERCLDGCPHRETCPFDAPSLYLATERGQWPRSVVSQDDDEGTLRALRDGPYGRCVYRSDNDVPDHQTVTISFANGVVATLTVSAFTAAVTRTTTVMCTRAEVRGRLDSGEIEVRHFRSNGQPDLERIQVAADGSHSLGDERMIAAFVARARVARQGLLAAESPTSLAESIDSHLMAFAAEESRRTGLSVHMEAR